MRPITCLAVLVLVAFSNAAIQKLGDVFHVDTRNPVHYPSSCLRTVDPDDADSVLYDPNAPASSRNKVLNQSWFWVSTVIGAVLAGIDSQSYESLFDTRKLMLSFFGIRQGRGPPAGTWEPTDMSQLPAQKLNFVRGEPINPFFLSVDLANAAIDRWRDAARAVSLTQQDDLKKPMLYVLAPAAASQDDPVDH